LGFDYNKLMVWARKALASLLVLVLLASLLGTALSTSANSALVHQQKVETWLNQSNLYQRFLSNAITQAKTSAGSNQAQGSITLSDSAVQQAADSAFSIKLFQRSLNTFLNSNYAWLEGKSAQPNFTIDLTGAKQNFAAQIGQYVQEHITSLPVCSAQQLAEIGSASNIDPLKITCRPPTLDAQAEAALVTQRVNNSGGFLSNPVITANNINPNGGSSSQPYYQKFSRAPKFYQVAVKLPWIYAVLAVISALGVILLARRKRNGLRRVGGSLVTIGVILLIIKFLANRLFNHLEKHVFNQTSDGQLQQSLTHFLNQVEAQMSKIILWFGIGYIILAAIILILLVLTRRRHSKHKASKPIPPGDSDSIASRLSNTPRQAPKTAPQPPRPAPAGPPPRPKRPPRLIQ
jgi:hypothetical protein